jgi:hypothetical protein
VDDDIVRETRVAEHGHVTNPRVREMLGLEPLAAPEPAAAPEPEPADTPEEVTG